MLVYLISEFRVFPAAVKFTQLQLQLIEFLNSTFGILHS